MYIFKIISFAIAVTIISVIIKQYKPEYGIQISLVAGIGILFAVSGSIREIFDYIEELCDLVGIDSSYVNILLKISGVSYLCEFSSALCKDAGENAMSVKIDIAGKITLIYLSLPVFKELLVKISEVAL